MEETFTTTTLNAATNTTDMKNMAATETLEGDDLIFYHSIRKELDLLKKNPPLHTIHHILNYSKSIR